YNRGPENVGTVNGGIAWNNGTANVCHRCTKDAGAKQSGFGGTGIAWHVRSASWRAVGRSGDFTWDGGCTGRQCVESCRATRVRRPYMGGSWVGGPWVLRPLRSVPLLSTLLLLQTALQFGLWSVGGVPDRVSVVEFLLLRLPVLLRLSLLLVP